MKGARHRAQGVGRNASGQLEDRGRKSEVRGQIADWRF